MKKYIVIIILLVLFVFAFFQWNGSKSWIVVDGKKFFVEVAKNDIERALGLMNRSSMLQDHGMIFVFEDEQIRKFWMKNTLIPLDMVFISKDLKIVDVQRAVPCISDPCVSYISKEPAQYVLEVNAGLVNNEQVIGKKIKMRLIGEKHRSIKTKNAM